MIIHPLVVESWHTGHVLCLPSCQPVGLLLKDDSRALTKSVITKTAPRCQIGSLPSLELHRKIEVNRPLLGLTAGERGVVLTVRDPVQLTNFADVGAFNRYFKSRTEHRLKLESCYLTCFNRKDNTSSTTLGRNHWAGRCIHLDEGSGHQIGFFSHGA
jgi:hypothetical protein